MNMKTTLWNQKGEKMGTVDLPSRLFDVAFNADMVHRALVAQRANARVAYAHTKGRGEVRGGGRKPWTQKGTGRARHGSIRSPIWAGGGVTFGPKNTRNFSKKINKKQKQKVLAMVLSSKANDNELAVLDALALSGPKTKEMAAVLSALRSLVFKSAPHKKVLVVVSGSADKTALLATRNLPNAKLVPADSLNIYDLLAYTFVVMPKDAVPVIERTYSKIK